MKKVIFGLVLVGLMYSMSFAQEKAEAKKGGIVPFLYSFFLDPRAGYKANEEDYTWVSPVLIHWLTGGLGTGVIACTDGGLGRGGIACCCGSLTPSGFSETDKYKIRGKEWARIIPVYNIIVHVQESIEAAQGVTWSEVIERDGIEK
jgi:hypothetical protein